MNDDKNSLMNLVPEGTANPKSQVLQEERFLTPDEIPEVELIEPPEPPPVQAQELGQVPTTMVSRQLSPAVDQAAGKIKQGLMKVKSDVWIGMALGAVIVLSARYAIHREL